MRKRTSLSNSLSQPNVLKRVRTPADVEQRQNRIDNFDNDLDGYTPAQGDCDDSNPNVFPGQVEDCNDGIDNDCDGFIDLDDMECM